LAGLGAPDEAPIAIQRNYLTKATALWNRSLLVGAERGIVCVKSGAC
jgi:hypothetical protein